MVGSMTELVDMAFIRLVFSTPAPSTTERSSTHQAEPKVSAPKSYMAHPADIPLASMANCVAVSNCVSLLTATLRIRSVACRHLVGGMNSRVVYPHHLTPTAFVIRQSNPEMCPGLSLVFSFPKLQEAGVTKTRVCTITAELIKDCCYDSFGE